VEAVLAEKPSFSWSISRHDCFATCRRRYFYSYYAAPVDPEIQRLKRLSALPLWTGSVVHETIEKVLRSFDRMPSDVEQEALVREAVHSRMLSDWRESEAGSQRFRLFEHEYVVPSIRRTRRSRSVTVMRSMRNFFKSETLRPGLRRGPRARLELEDLVSFKVGETSVFLRMDLAYRATTGAS
jgi:hypothetical protein